ncbi:12030_t:CDS:2, partial [Ambispora gerdemannii]
MGTSVVYGTKIFNFGGRKQLNPDIVQYDVMENLYSLLSFENSPNGRRGLNSAIDQKGRWHIYSGSNGTSDEYNLTPITDQN